MQLCTGSVRGPRLDVPEHLAHSIRMGTTTARTGAREVGTAASTGDLGERPRGGRPLHEQPLHEPPLVDRYAAVREQTQHLCAPLTPEDHVVQTMADVSPTKWHLAHVTWFFETFLLRPHDESYVSPCDAYQFLFNSYYNAVGDQFYRPHRGHISRPTVQEVLSYRRTVDDAMRELLLRRQDPEIASLVELGLHHEQQHQELILTDIKHVLAQNPMLPSYRPSDDGALDGAFDGPRRPATEPSFIAFEGGVRRAGADGKTFCYDNERPRHDVLLTPFALASRLVTAGEFVQFIEDDGYRTPSLWLSDGWKWAQENAATPGWGGGPGGAVDGHGQAPLYWHHEDGAWHVYTLSGLKPLDPLEPACHVSFFEADAFARWAGKRLPREHELELASADQSVEGNFADRGRYHPRALALPTGARVEQLYGDVWEWTMSPYVAYPGYRAAPGALGEYNGKFMCNQMVLRGGSCATPAGHMRSTYRNFFPADARWQFSGIRLAEDR